MDRVKRKAIVKERLTNKHSVTARLTDKETNDVLLTRRYNRRGAWSHQQVMTEMRAEAERLGYELVGDNLN